MLSLFLSLLGRLIAETAGVAKHNGSSATKLNKSVLENNEQRNRYLSRHLNDAHFCHDYVKRLICVFKR